MQTNESDLKFGAGDRVVITGGNEMVGQEGLVRYFSPDDNYVAVKMLSGMMKGFDAANVALAHNPADDPAKNDNPAQPAGDGNGAMSLGTVVPAGGTTATVTTQGESADAVSEILSRKPDTFKRVLESFEKDRKY